MSARGDMHFDVINERMNSEKFIEFLKKLRSDANCPIFVITDNARYHHSKKVQAFLPVYLSELNSGEQVWNHAKEMIWRKQFYQLCKPSSKAKLTWLKVFFSCKTTYLACTVKTFGTINISSWF